MKTVEGCCFSCRDQLEFQFHGLKLEYDPEGVEAQYIDSYRKIGCPTIKCENCGRAVRYEKQVLTGRWIEVEEA